MALKAAILASGLALALSVGPVSASCPDGWPDTPTEFARADRVVVGWVSEARTIIDPDDFDAILATEFVVQTLNTYKGERAASFTIYNSNDSGRFDMEFRHSYLLFLTDLDGRWVVSNCGNSFDLEWTDATYSPKRPGWTFEEIMAYRPQAEAALDAEVRRREALGSRSDETRGAPTS
ncbi:hypothetical protein [Brevundimonas sp. FT23028]|uniref:hypothetical protein n=1 Tax=Brevundimonas sp. FT23028 TaxID=3393748 RepID=UPI003B589257